MSRVLPNNHLYSQEPGSEVEQLPLKSNPSGNLPVSVRALLGCQPARCFIQAPFNITAQKQSNKISLHLRRT